MVLSWENSNLNHCKQQQNEVRLTTFSFLAATVIKTNCMASAFFWVIFKFVLLDVTGLFIRRLSHKPTYAIGT